MFDNFRSASLIKGIFPSSISSPHVLHRKALGWHLLESLENRVPFPALAVLVTLHTSPRISLPCRNSLLFLSLSASEFITWHELNEMQPNSSRVNHVLKLWSLLLYVWSQHPSPGADWSCKIAGFSRLTFQPTRAPTLAPVHRQTGPTQTHTQASSMAHLAFSLAPSPVQSSPLNLYSNRVPKRLICQFNFKCFALQEYSSPKAGALFMLYTSE